MPITHAKVSAIPDDAAAEAAGEVLPSDWNDEHVVSLTAAEAASALAPLVREDANTYAQRNGTTAQSLYVYNTYTDASNYERGHIRWAGNLLRIGTAKAGTGSERGVLIEGASGAGGVIYFGPDARTTINGNIVAAVNYLGYNLNSASFMAWGNDSFAPSASDTGLGRISAGVLSVCDGSTRTNYRDLIARNLRTNPVTVATLTAAATAGAGARSFVTDANATTFNSVVAGGGANKVPVFSDGADWRIG